MNTNALAKALALNDMRFEKQVLDSLTDGKRRVWQKIGWGPSKTRSKTKMVIRALFIYQISKVDTSLHRRR